MERRGKETILDKLKSSMDTSLRKAVLTSIFPLSSGLQTRAENSVGEFDNSIPATLKYGFIHGHASVDLAVSEDDGHLVLQNFWIVFLGSKGLARAHGAMDYEHPSPDLPFFYVNEEEAVFNIEYMTLSKDKKCDINMTHYF